MFFMTAVLCRSSAQASSEEDVSHRTEAPEQEELPSVPDRVLINAHHACCILYAVPDAGNLL